MSDQWHLCPQLLRVLSETDGSLPQTIFLFAPTSSLHRRLLFASSECHQHEQPRANWALESTGHPVRWAATRPDACAPQRRLFPSVCLLYLFSRTRHSNTQMNGSAPPSSSMSSVTDSAASTTPRSSSTTPPSSPDGRSPSDAGDKPEVGDASDKHPEDVLGVLDDRRHFPLLAWEDLHGWMKSVELPPIPLLAPCLYLTFSPTLNFTPGTLRASTRYSAIGESRILSSAASTAL